ISRLCRLCSASEKEPPRLRGTAGGERYWRSSFFILHFSHELLPPRHLANSPTALGQLAGQLQSVLVRHFVTRVTGLLARNFDRYTPVANYRSFATHTPQREKTLAVGSLCGNDRRESS